MAAPLCCPRCSADPSADELGRCRRCGNPLPPEMLALPGAAPLPAPAKPLPDGRPVKVTLDLTQLLAEGKINQDEFDRLIVLSRRDTKLHAYSIGKVLAFIAIAAGAVGLFPEAFSILGRALFELLGSRGMHLAFVVLAGAGAYRADSGFLAGLCAYALLTFLGDAGLFYTHATYGAAIEEPALTAVFFSAFAYGSYALAAKVEARRKRVVIIFSRTCLFIVNQAFWIGSLWGSKFVGVTIPDYVFALGWAIALAAVGLWAATEDKRWVVNTTAVFGSIHFYTQWFERLGASPASLMLAGCTALAFLYKLREYNRARAA